MGENLVYNSSVQVGSHHYARLFAEENDVLWLSLPWNIFLYLKYGKTGERYKQWNDGKINMTEKIKTFCPFTFVPYRDNFPFGFKKNISRTLKYTSPNLKKVLQNNHYDECDVLWITDPRMMYLSELVKYKKLVYRCVDDLSHFSGIPSNVVVAEKELVQKADIVFATANTLKERLLEYRQDVYSLPNAVDFDFFYNYETINKECSIESFDNVILYVGTIGEWFDCEFVRYCAEKRPQYNFVLIGPERTDTSQLRGVGNIHILGPKPYVEIPLYMKRSQIGIIPFKKNNLVDAVNPLKLYEYFACGLPVVATKAYELEKMSSPAKLYAEYDEALGYFDDLMGNAIDENILYEYARENSWRKRYKYIMKYLVNDKED